MKISPLDETTQFKIIIEQLEICCSFLKEKSIAKYRVALILLDNISEILLHRSCQQIFERDDFIKWIMPQKFPTSSKKKINRYFDEKIKVIEKERKIPKDITKILSIGHKYRNAIYHRDTHNPTTIGIVTKILFITICDLFAKTRCGINVSVIGGHNEPPKWLSSYNIKTTYIDFAQASKIISETLKKRIPVNLSSSVAIFWRDLENRIKNIQKMIAEELPWKKPEEIDHVLKGFEFREVNPHIEDELSMEYRKYIYKIAQKQPVDIEPPQLKQIEKDFQKEYHARVEEYQPKISYSIINRILRSKDKLYRAENIEKALTKYFTLDELLSKLEYYIELAAIEWDKIVQREIDLERGK